MKVFIPDQFTRFLIFALAFVFIADLLVYALKEWKRISSLDASGKETKGSFTNIRAEIVRRKLKSTADLAYRTETGEEIRWLWQKGFFDEEVLLFRNTDKKRLDVTVKYDPRDPKNMYVADCYNRRKHLLVIVLCFISAAALAYCLLAA